MAHAGPTEGETAALPLQRVVSHKRLVALMLSRSVNEGRRDAAPVPVEDREEMLHCAASQGLLCSVLALLKDGRFSHDVPDRFGRTPLHWAAEQGHRDVVLALLEAGACVDPRSQRNNTPIMLAASRGHVEVVGVLLHYRAGESDCWPLNRDRRGIGHWRSTALHCAAAGGHVRLVEVLLDAGFDRGQHDGAGLTPAEVSARKSHSTSAAITHLLLPTNDRGGKLVHDYVNMTVQDVPMVSGLVRGGSFLDWQGGTGDTPLHRAVHFHHAIIVRLLLRAGADPNVRNHQGASPLHGAARAGRQEIVANLLEAGADTELLTIGGYSPLLAAVANNRVNGNRMDVVRLLLNAGGSTEHRDAMHGQTALSWACRGGLAPIVRVLMEAGAKVESRSSAGLTPLHWACRFNNAESVEVLLNAGADPSAVDQAAADAVATPSSTNGTIIAMPTAIDVIGLGYPLDRLKDSIRPSETLAPRRLDVVAVKRIQSALQAAKRECSWRRRGLLVMLKNRCVAVKLSGVRDIRWAVYRSGWRDPILAAPMRSRCVYDIVERPPCLHHNGATTDAVDISTNNDISDSRHPREEPSNRQSTLGKRLGSVDDAMVPVRGTYRPQGQTCGDIGAQEDVTAVLSEVVDALLALAAAESGLFRRVVMFI